MKKYILFPTILLLAVFSNLSVLAINVNNDASSDITEDSLIKSKTKSTVYYYASDGKRYVFPNAKTYYSWFTDFSDVVEVDDERLAEISLAGNVRYRPGVVMVKIKTDPKVYAVGKNGLLRWIKTEELAEKLYGENWHLLIDDVPDVFFINYHIGSAIESESDFDPDDESEDTPTINHNRRLRITIRAKRSNTSKCRAIPATPAVPAHKQGGKGRATPAIPATPARDCAHQKKQANGIDDITPPVISDISTIVGTTTATITWTTDEESTSIVEYATESLSTATTTKTASSSDLVISHEIELIDLATSTMYYFIIESTDAENNSATSTEQTFTTTQ